jgi:hypothetical protein
MLAYPIFQTEVLSKEQFFVPKNVTTYDVDAKGTSRLFDLHGRNVFP